MSPFVESSQAPLISTDEEVFSPTSEPSKYMANVPLVDEPVVPLKTKRSSSAPEAPVPPNDPTVLIMRAPFGARPMASISSPDNVSPTSEPSKYQLKEPAVFEPSEVGVKRKMSLSSTVPKPAKMKSDASRLS